MVLMDYRDHPDGGRETIYRKTCPWNDLDEDVYEIAALYRHYEKGHLLVSGGLEDQPAWYVEAMDCFTIAMNHWQADSIERSKEQAKSQTSKGFKK